jgi:hypothetical protein
LLVLMPAFPLTGAAFELGAGLTLGIIAVALFVSAAKIRTARKNTAMNENNFGFDFITELQSA